MGSARLFPNSRSFCCNACKRVIFERDQLWKSNSSVDELVYQLNMPPVASRGIKGCKTGVYATEKKTQETSKIGHHFVFVDYLLKLQSTKVFKRSSLMMDRCCSASKCQIRK